MTVRERARFCFVWAIVPLCGVLGVFWLGCSSALDLPDPPLLPPEECYGFGPPTPNVEQRHTFDENSDVITNPWLGLGAVGDSYRLLKVRGSGTEPTDVIWQLSRKERFAGVNCAVVQTIETKIERQETTVTQELWLAQDTAGNVCLLRWSGIVDDDWAADSAEDAYVLFPANAQAGQVARYPGEDSYVEILGFETVGPLSTGAGPYADCLRIRLTRKNTFASFRYYEDLWWCAGVGLVKAVEHCWTGASVERMP